MFYHFYCLFLYEKTYDTKNNINNFVLVFKIFKYIIKQYLKINTKTKIIYNNIYSNFYI